MADKNQILDLYFMDARSKLIDLAAFLDRVDRADGEADFRLEALRHAMKALDSSSPSRAADILRALSDPSTEAVDQAPYQGAIGANPPAKH